MRVFATFTEDLERLTDWLEQCGVTTVALECTGVYWIPLFEILEQRGIRPCLVNARHMKNVPGRRTDWHECQWLQFLHSVGLLRAAFRPGQDICAVRTVLRHRSELVAAASQHVQHMHKALTQMNLQIHHVINDITGLTGLAIVDAILAGQRDGAELAKLRHPNIFGAACSESQNHEQQSCCDRFADDWVVTCRSAAEARAAMGVARRILKQLGVELHPQKTRIVHVRYGFEFLGYKIKCGWRKLSLPGNTIRSQARQDALYAYPKEKSISRFMDQVRQRTKRTTPLRTEELNCGA